MENLKELMASGRSAEEIVGLLKTKVVDVPAWGKLVKEYDPEKHPVVTEPTYQDVAEKGGIDKVTRVTYDLQRLAVNRMKELCFGIPVKRVYDTHGNAQEQEAADIIEAILERNRIDSVNIDRAGRLFASCEVMTLWYGVNQPNNYYGVDSPLKLRCATYSPMDGDTIYPLFDERGDLVALSIEYTRTIGEDKVTFFDTYTDDRHVKWSNKEGWHVLENEEITIGKIPGIYAYRPTPIWENTSRLVYEMEWAMSRNGNYLRKNSRPLLAVFSDDGAMVYEGAPGQDKAFKDVAQFPQGARIEYVTWNQSIENLKFHLSELRQQFFTQLQLPDWSYESMKSAPMSGESRKQLFIDAQLKVKDESARLLEFLDREINVLKAFVKVIAPSLAQDVDALGVASIITPFMLGAKEDEVTMLANATGGKPIMSQKTAIERLGVVKDADEELAQINAEAAATAIESAF